MVLDIFELFLKLFEQLPQFSILRFFLDVIYLILVSNLNDQIEHFNSLRKVFMMKLEIGLDSSGT